MYVINEIILIPSSNNQGSSEHFNDKQKMLILQVLWR